MNSSKVRTILRALVLSEGLGGGSSGSSDIISDVYTAENRSNVNIKRGQPCAVHSSGIGVSLASCDNIGNRCIGFAYVNINSSYSGIIETDGIIKLDDWTLITGQPTLTPKAMYYLDVISGKINNIVPNGLFLQSVGIAMDLNNLKVQIEPEILL